MNSLHDVSKRLRTAGVWVRVNARTASPIRAPSRATHVGRHVTRQRHRPWQPGLLVAVVSMLLTSVSAVAQTASQQAQTNLPRTTLSVGMYRIDTQIASTEEQRETGLMYRRDMPGYEGMLFVFSIPGVQCFWMKNTRIPLTAAFLTDDGTIVNLADMQPFDETSHCSAQPVRFVLEMNQGWFKQHGVQVGDTIRGTPFQSN